MCIRDRYGAGPFEQQQFGTAGVEGVNNDAGRIVTMNASDEDKSFIFKKMSKNFRIIYNRHTLRKQMAPASCSE